MAHLLQVDGLSLEFIENGRRFKALNNISFHLEKGEILGLVGESGCGKSLTVLSVIGLLPPGAVISGGDIFFNGNSLLHMDENEKCKIRGKDIVMIFQESLTALNPVVPIGKQITEMLRIHQKLSREQAAARVVALMEKIGLPRAERLYHEYPHQLSGGMRQRVMIAMALVNNPSLLLADEPTTALDVTIQAQILDLIVNLNQEYGISLIFVSHDLGVLKKVCSRILVMYSGEIVEEGPSNQVFENPLHPYTRGLIAAIPSFAKKGSPLATIEGIVPLLTDRRPDGCCFAPRCQAAEEVCFEKVPLIVKFGQQMVKCHAYQRGTAKWLRN